MVLRRKMIEGLDAFFEAAFPGFPFLGVCGNSEDEHDRDQPGMLTGLSAPAEQEVWVYVGAGKEEAGEIADDDDNKMTVDSEHKGMMSEVIATEIEKQCLLLPSTYFGRGQKGIRRKEDTGDNADVDPLAACTRAEET